MKRKSYKFSTVLIIILTNLLISSSIFAQSPDKMSYQAVIRDGDDALVANTQVGMQISILQGSAVGPAIYTETQTPTTNANGLVTIEIGGGTPVIGTFNDIEWSTGTYFIKTEIATEEPLTTYTITGTSQLLSVPYALYAETAAAYTETDPEVGANTVNYLSKWDGTALVSSIVFDNGKVGIGTTSPNGYLEVTDKGDMDPHNLMILGQTVTTNRLRFSSGTNYAIISVGPSIDENKGLVIIHSTGYIGMGKSDPSTKLDVNGIITATGANFTGTTTVPTPVNETDAATKAYVDELMNQLYEQGVLKLIDIDNNYYNTIKIGDQIWMAENLKVTHYSNGDAIPLVTGNGSWASLVDDNTDKAYCWYNDDKATYEYYGAYYTYAAATDGDNTGNDVQGACPVGWHIPNDSEWEVLYTYLGGLKGTTGSQLAGNEALWTDGLLDSNEDFGTSGFNGIPGGGRSPTDGTFTIEGIKAYFWSSTESGFTNQSGKIELDYDDSGIFRHNIHYKSSAISIRCIKDAD